jgi:SAM-dependent methyltransferase
MRDSLRQETASLVRSWMRHEDLLLRDYLVAGVEDPRLNLQSLISRQFLITAGVGDRFQELMDAELRFAVAANWLLDLFRAGSCREAWLALRQGLRCGADDADGIEIPAWIRLIFQSLPASAGGLIVPNYLEQFLTSLVEGAGWEFDNFLGLFMGLWREALASAPPAQPPLRVLEPACGSANDYRFIDRCGLGRLIDYTGFDLCPKNVDNARALFPSACFEVGNVFEIAAPDLAFDCVFVHDLFEHLSLEGIEAAAGEICRVTRTGICLGFFNMDEMPDHIVRPHEEYHWNTLSMERMRSLFEGLGFQTQVVHIGAFLRSATGCDRTHNPNAYSFLLRR